MGRKLRRNASRCLLCFSSCPEEDPDSDPRGGAGNFRKAVSGHGNGELKLTIPGAVNCAGLGLQLERWFILRQVLDIPVSWCEQTLGRRRGKAPGGGVEGDGVKVKTEEGEEDDDMDGDGGEEGNDGGRGSLLESWFKICGSCLGGSVREAWEAYQKLMAVQTRLTSIKGEIKRRMKEGMESHWRSYSVAKGFKGRRRGDEMEVEDEIRDLVFPELIQELETSKWTTPKFDDDDDDESPEDSLYDPPGESDSDGDDDTEFLITASPQPKMEEDDPQNLNMSLPDLRHLPTVKRRRGRPKKNERCPTSNPLLYYSKHYGTLKRIKFKWKICPLCPARYKHDEDYQRHMEVHERRKGQSGPGDFDCKKCSFIAADMVELGFHVRNRHQRDHTTQHPCPHPKCDFATKVWKVLKLHVAQFHKDITEAELESRRKFKCSSCSQEFRNKRVLTNHMKRAHPEVLGIQHELLECDQCHIKFATKQELYSHIYSSHNQQAKYICGTCGKGFPFISRLQSHEVSHEKMTPRRREHVCHLCGCDYTTKYTLDKHYDKFHPEESPFRRSESGKGAASASSGAAATINTGEEFRCKYCDLTSPFKVLIKRHMETHKKEFGHKCDQCGKCYTNEQGLKRHIRINHPLNNEGVPCPYCLKLYPSVEYMKDHLNKFCKLKKLPSSGSTVTPSTSTTAAGAQSSAATEESESVDVDVSPNVGGHVHGGGGGGDEPESFKTEDSYSVRAWSYN